MLEHARQGILRKRISFIKMKTSMHRQVIVYIAASLDGYIAEPNDDLSFLSVVEKEGEDYGYHDFVSTIDTVLVGRKTYDWVMNHVPEFPHADKNTYVITRTPREKIGKTQFYTGDLKNLVEQLRSESGKNIFVDGGADLVNALLKEDLIDEIIVSIIPVLLGGGVRLFQEGWNKKDLQLISSKQYEKGLVQLHYSCI